jgi:threonine synthase
MAKQGLWQEISSSAALAALNMVESFENDGPIVLMGCSTGLKEPTKPAQAQAISPDIASLRAYLKTEFGFEF